MGRISSRDIYGGKTHGRHFTGLNRVFTESKLSGQAAAIVVQPDEGASRPNPDKAGGATRVREIKI